jgi:hypothetical protein
MLPSNKSSKMSDKHTHNSPTRPEQHCQLRPLTKLHASRMLPTLSINAHSRQQDEDDSNLTPPSVGRWTHTSAQPDEDDWKPKHNNRLVEPSPSQFLQSKKPNKKAKKTQFTDPPEFLEHKTLNDETALPSKISASRFLLSEEATDGSKTGRPLIPLQEENKRNRDYKGVLLRPCECWK